MAKMGLEMLMERQTEWSMAKAALAMEREGGECGCTGFSVTHALSKIKR